MLIYWSTSLKPLQQTKIPGINTTELLNMMGDVIANLWVSNDQQGKSSNDQLFRDWKQLIKQTKSGKLTLA